MDTFTPEFRSEVMSRIRSTGTRPEEQLAGLIRASLGHRWRIVRNDAALPGRPDIVIPSLQVCIFADGCFFHRCPQHWRVPGTRPEYWVPKIEGNVRRDRRIAAALRQQGYSVWRVWEHDLRPRAIPGTAERLARRLQRRRDQVASQPRRSREVTLESATVLLVTKHVAGPTGDVGLRPAKLAGGHTRGR